MKTLIMIVAGKISGKPCYDVTPIKKYVRITGEEKGQYLGENPVWYEETDGSCHTGQLDDIGFADMSKALFNLGDIYRIPKEHISTIV